MGVSAIQVKELRSATGAPILDCKKALEKNKGDLEQAVDWLRKQGLSSVAKKAGREVSEGLIDSYIHPGNRVGVIV
ncbi:MAG TPA: elongation factor Ts, partial [Chloroflexi bacterium]|nr:elongation factor Ts [Chloroflexota bacterium]